MATTRGNEPLVKKRSDAYTGILAISFLALVGACVLLYLEYQNYEGKTIPAAPKIDVPGARLEAVKGSGGPPAPKKIDNTPPDNPMKEPKDGTMRLSPRPDEIPASLPPLLPAEVVRPIADPDTIVIPPVQRAEFVQPQKASEPIIPLPNVDPLSPVDPAPLPRAKSPDPKPIVPASEPTLDDEPPPLPNKRFDPSR
jgi:hypothetical protein